MNVLIVFAYFILLLISGCTEKEANNKSGKVHNETVIRDNKKLAEAILEPIDIVDESLNIYSSFQVNLKSPDNYPEFITVLLLENGVIVDPRGNNGDVFLLDFNSDYGDNKIDKDDVFWGCSVNLKIDSITGFPRKITLIPYFSDGNEIGDKIEFEWKEFSEISRFFRYATEIP